MRVFVSWLLAICISFLALMFSVAGNPVLHVTEFEEIRRFGIGSVNAMAFHPDNQSLVVGTQTGLYSYSVPDLQQISNFNFFNEAVHDLVWSPDGQWLTFATPSAVYIWNNDTHKTQLLVDNLLAAKLDWSPDGTEVAAIGFDTQQFSSPPQLRVNLLYRWHLTQHEWALSTAPTTVQVASFGFDDFVWAGEYMISFSDYNQSSLIAWTVVNPTNIILLGDFVPGITITISPDKRFLIVNNYFEELNVIPLLNLEDLQWTYLPSEQEIFSESSIWGHTVLITSDIYRGKQITLFDFNDWAEIDKYQPDYYLNLDTGTSISNDDQYISAIVSGNLVLIDVVTWQIVKFVPTYLHHNGIYSPLAYNSDGTLIATVQSTPLNKNYIQVMNIRTGIIIAKIDINEENIKFLSFSPNGEYLVLGIVPPDTYPSNILIVNIQEKKLFKLDWPIHGTVTDIVWRENDILVSLDGIVYRLVVSDEKLTDRHLFKLERLIHENISLHAYKIVTCRDQVFLQEISRSFTAYLQGGEMQWKLDRVQLPQNPSSPNCNFLVTQYRITEIQIRAIESGTIISEIPMPEVSTNAVAWHNDDFLAIAIHPHSLPSYIEFWAVDSQGELIKDHPIYTIDAHKLVPIGCCASLANINYLWWVGDNLYSVGIDGTIRVWGIPD